MVSPEKKRGDGGTGVGRSGKRDAELERVTF